MDAFVTIRLPALSTAETETELKTSAPPVAAATEPSDEALMARICVGDNEALTSLFRRYARLVRGVAYRILRDPSEADDLLQEVFLYLYRKSEVFDGSKSSARSWIVQVTCARAIDRRRYLLSRHFYAQVDLEEVINKETEPTSGDQLGAIVDQAVARKLFDTLSENQRETLRLFFFEGYTLGEIALKLGQTRGNVKHHYARGLEKLRKLLQGTSQRQSAV